MQTCILPCRHVMYIRKVSNYETVIPPNQTLAARWIVQSPANKIEDGDVLPGGLNRVNCPPIRAQPPANRDIKYMQSKQLSERIVDVLSLQPSTTYRLGMKWISGFHTALRTGNLKNLLAKDLQTRVASKIFRKYLPLATSRRPSFPSPIRVQAANQKRNLKKNVLRKREAVGEHRLCSRRRQGGGV